MHPVDRVDAISRTTDCDQSTRASALATVLNITDPDAVKVIQAALEAHVVDFGALIQAEIDSDEEDDAVLGKIQHIIDTF